MSLLRGVNHGPRAEVSRHDLLQSLEPSIRTNMCKSAHRSFAKDKIKAAANDVTQFTNRTDMAELHALPLFCDLAPIEYRAVGASGTERRSRGQPGALLRK